MSETPRTRGEPQYLQVAGSIRGRIHAGELADGAALPSTRELAERWGVSVFTVNEAMRVLAEEGLVVSKSRSNRVVHFPEGRRRPARPERPQVLLIGGWPGSGKSQLARAIARQTGWAILDKDTLTRPVMESALELAGVSPLDQESRAPRQQVRPRQYEALIDATVEQVECGNSAATAAPFSLEFRDRAWLDRMTARMTSLGADAHLVWVHCDPDSMRSYLRHRGAARDAAKLADWPGYLNGIDLGFRPVLPHMLVDNSASSAPLEHQARDLVDRIAVSGRAR